MFQPGRLIPYIPPRPDGGKVTPPDPRKFKLLAISGRSEIVDYSQEVTLRHVFLNDTGCVCEASFQFPTERGCAVTRFSADVNGRHIEAQVEEKQKAEEKYDDAIASGSSAFMAQQVEGDTALNMNIGNVEKDAEIVVSVSYLAELKVEGEKLSVAMGPKGRIPFSDDAVKAEGFVNGFSYDVHVLSSIGVSPDEGKRTDYKVELNNDGKEALYKIAEGVKDFKPLENLLISLAEPHKTTVSVQQFNKEDKNKFVAVSLFPKVEGEVKSEMIFLIDRSGSMSGSLIERAKETLQFFLRSMPEGVLFNIIGFGFRYETMFKESVPYNDENLEIATAKVNKIKADLGGTDIYSPLKYIFGLDEIKGFPRQVFILTDGEVDNANSCISIVRDNAHTTRVFTFGIGSGADAALCEDTAKAGNGACVMIRESKDMRELVMKQLDYALRPGISDISVEWDDKEIKQAPAHIQPVFDGAILNVYGLVPEGVKEGKHSVTITGRTDKDKDGEKSFREVVEFDTSNVVPGTNMIKTAVKKLLDDLKDKKEIVSLSTKYGVLHSSTAFVAVGPMLKDPASGDVKLEKVSITRSSPRSSNFGFFGCPPPMPMMAPGLGCPPPMMSCFAAAPLMGCGCPPPPPPPTTGKSMAPAGFGYAPPPAPCAPPPPPTAMNGTDDGDLFCCDDELECACCEDDMEDACCEDDMEEECECSPPPKAEPVAKPAVKKPEPPAKFNLDQVIMHQKANGSFKLDVLRGISVPEERARSLLPSHDGIDDETAFLVWVTIIVLKHLEVKEASRKSEWAFIAQKSQKWAEARLSHQKFEEWSSAAETLVKSL